MAQLIGAATRATVARINTSLMPDTAVITTPAPPTDDGTTYTPGTPTTSSPIACRAFPTRARPADTPAGGQPQAVEDWTITFDPGVGLVVIDEKARIAVTFRDAAGFALASRTFEVAKNESPTSYSDMLGTVVRCQEV